MTRTINSIRRALGFAPLPDRPMPEMPVAPWSRMPSMTACYHCDYWQARAQPQASDVQIGDCRRMPPFTDEIGGRGVWPYTRHDDGCADGSGQ